MTWAVYYRVQGKGDGAGVRLERLSGPKQRFALGEYPTISLAEAREHALAVKRLARSGADPVETLHPKPKAVVRVQNLIERYAAEHLRRNMKAGANVEKLLRLHVAPRWGECALSAISRGDFVSLLEEIRKPQVVKVDGLAGSYNATRGGPGSAAEVRKWMRAMFQFAVDVQLLSENPLADVRNRDRQKPRSRVLTMDELRSVWHAAGRMEHPWGPYFPLIMLTGDRRGEWANAQTGWLDPERTRLEVPATHYKDRQAPRSCP
jgi:Arm DNA-binding domain